MMPRPLLGVAVATALTLAPAPALAGDEKAWDIASSAASHGLIAVALGLPLIKGDGIGALQAGGSVVAAELVTLGLKEAFPHLRPDGSDHRSFPSGHTSRAFAAATSLYDRQGPSIGVPALVVATFVGVARVKADKHHWYDSVVGAGIGAAAGFLITSKPGAQVAIVPWGDTKGGGLSALLRF